MTSDQNTNEPNRARQTIVDIVVGSIMLLLAFFAIAATDVSAIGTRWYWAALVALYAFIAVMANRIHIKKQNAPALNPVTILLHWLGVFLAVQLVYYFVAAGLITNADTGLANGLILALGSYLFGIHSGWRMIVIGTALAAATVGVAFVEEYLWVLFIVAILALLIIALGDRLVKQHKSGKRPGPA